MEIPAYAYRMLLTVSPEHIDALNHVNNVVYLQWVQDVSAEHWSVLCPEELRKKYIWVVRRHELDYFRSAMLHDELEIYTWPTIPEGHSSVRHVVMKNLKTGKLLMQAKTTWTRLDENTLRPIVVPPEVIEILDWAQPG